MSKRLEIYQLMCTIFHFSSRVRSQFYPGNVKKCIESDTFYFEFLFELVIRAGYYIYMTKQIIIFV